MIVRKKPVTVEAHQWTGMNIGDTWVFMGCPAGGLTLVPDQKDLVLMVLTIEGDLASVRPGDWVMKGIRGELYPCKANIFDDTYEFL